MVYLFICFRAFWNWVSNYISHFHYLYALQKVDDDASIHDRLLWAIHMSGFDDLVKFLASAQSEKQWSMHVLEIISLMFRDQVRHKNHIQGLHRDLQLFHMFELSFPYRPQRAW